MDFQSGVIGIDVPTWNLALPLSLLALYLHRRDRRLSRLEANLCTKCTYDRAGLPPGSPCPECGTIPPPTPPLRDSAAPR